jgi:hypothetical protein
MYLEPLSFEEFLDAVGEQGLKEYVERYNWTTEIPKAIHMQLMKTVREYMLVGGMPAAVSTWIDGQVLDKVSQIHFDLLSTYRDDFSKYSGRLSIDRLEEVMSAVPRQIGGKFVYSKINPEVSSVSLKQSLNLLVKARVCHQVFSTSANGLPLGAEVNKRYMKMLMLDCGLCSVSLGLTLQELQSVAELIMINSGGMAEQFVGQQLRTIFPAFVSPSLYYWQRTEKSSNSEIDYIIQHENQVIPIKVKAGSAGSLKSLHQFMKQKGTNIAIRINSDYPRKGPISIKEAFGPPIEYGLLSLPFYLIGQIHRLINSSNFC